MLVSFLVKYRDRFYHITLLQEEYQWETARETICLHTLRFSHFCIFSVIFVGTTVGKALN